MSERMQAQRTLADVAPHPAEFRRRVPPRLIACLCSYASPSPSLQGSLRTTTGSVVCGLRRCQCGVFVLSSVCLGCAMLMPIVVCVCFFAHTRAGNPPPLARQGAVQHPLGAHPRVVAVGARQRSGGVQLLAGALAFPSVVLSGRRAIVAEALDGSFASRLLLRGRCEILRIRFGVIALTLGRRRLSLSLLRMHTLAEEIRWASPGAPHLREFHMRFEVPFMLVCRSEG